jgi:hypothetical protein
MITMVATDLTATEAKVLADALSQANQDQVRDEVLRNAAP